MMSLLILLRSGLLMSLWWFFRFGMLRVVLWMVCL